jgi:predicted small metal-binding protein
LLSVLEIDCNCGWSGRAETRDELLEVIKKHVVRDHPEEPRDESLLRAVIAQRAREVVPGQ